MTARTKGHALRKLAWDEEAKAYRWSCECGQHLGAHAVHAARKVWREHKATSNPEVAAS